MNTGRNDIAAYGDDDAKLGNEHNRAPEGDFGPWDGLLDRGAEPVMPSGRPWSD